MEWVGLDHEADKIIGEGQTYEGVMTITILRKSLKLLDGTME